MVVVVVGVRHHESAADCSNQYYQYWDSVVVDDDVAVAVDNACRFDNGMVEHPHPHLPYRRRRMKILRVGSVAVVVVEGRNLFLLGGDWDNYCYYHSH